MLISKKYLYKQNKGIDMIVLIGGEKGGTGKTTIATNLAAMCVLNNKDTLLIDTDKQGSASSWIATRQFNDIKPDISSIQKFGNNLYSQVIDLSNRYGEIIIDAGGRDSVELRSAMTVANKVYIPIQASQFDIWTLNLIDRLVSEVKVVNPNLEAFIVLNRASTNPSLNEINEAREVILEFDNLKLSPSVVRDRVAYRKAAKKGHSVVELDKKDEKASHEIGELYKEIYCD
jgi:chromosome partitioning protein